MVPYGGRSLDTVKMPKKPIPQGYKIWGLGFAGYYYDWLGYSPRTGTEGNTGKGSKNFPRKGAKAVVELADTQ